MPTDFRAPYSKHIIYSVDEGNTPRMLALQHAFKCYNILHLHACIIHINRALFYVPLSVWYINVLTGSSLACSVPGVQADAPILNAGRFMQATPVL